MGGLSKILQLILLVIFIPSSSFSLTTSEDQSSFTSTAEYEASPFEFSSSVNSNLIASSTNIPITGISTIDNDQSSSETNAITALQTSKTVTKEPITTQEKTTEKIIVSTNIDMKNNTANMEVTSISSTSLISDTSSRTFPTSTASSLTTQARTTTSDTTVPTTMSTTSATTLPIAMTTISGTTVPTVMSTTSATTVPIAMSATSESLSTQISQNITSAETTTLTSTESISKSSSPTITSSETLSSKTSTESTSVKQTESSSVVTTESSTTLKTSESQTTTTLTKSSTKPSTQETTTTTPLSTTKEKTTVMTTNRFINEIDSLNSNISELNDRITTLRVAVAVLSVLLAMVVIGCILYFVRQRMRPVKSPFEEMHGDKVDVERSKDEVTRRPYFDIAHNPYRASTASLGGEDTPASFSATFKPQGHTEAGLNASSQGIVMEEILLNDGSFGSSFTHNQDIVARDNNVDV